MRQWTIGGECGAGAVEDAGCGEGDARTSGELHQRPGMRRRWGGAPRGVCASVLMRRTSTPRVGPLLGIVDEDEDGVGEQDGEMAEIEEDSEDGGTGTVSRSHSSSRWDGHDAV